MSGAKLFSVFKNDLFGGKVAIVTGGATGIGKAIAKELLHLGCKVVIASRKEDVITSAVKEMEGLFTDKPSRISGMLCNIRKEDQVQNLVSDTIKTFGRIDYLVNNGGGQFLSRVADITSKGFDAVVETNLKGAFFMSKEVYNQWMKDNGGVIVNILMEFYRGVPMMGHSGAARSGLDNLTKTMAIEWAENGVRVNAVAPGNAIYSPTAEKNYGDDIFSLVRPNLPTKRLGTPEEISSAVCYLLSPGASFISGETLFVDGGSRFYSPLMYNIPEHEKLPVFDGAGGDEEKKKSKL